jgi:hypothetical protein
VKVTKELLDAARAHVMTDAEREEQRRSFAYGNLKLHDETVTREQIDRAADNEGGGA